MGKGSDEMKGTDLLLFTCNPYPFSFPFLPCGDQLEIDFKHLNG